MEDSQFNRFKAANHKYIDYNVSQLEELTLVSLGLGRQFSKSVKFSSILLRG